MSHEKRVQEILKAHGLDFTINKYPLSATDETGKVLISPYFGLYNSKSNACINTCKAGYTVSQNAELVDMILRGAEKFSTDLNVSKAGSINGGRRVYMQMAVKGMSKVGDDDITRYITIIDSNDGSTSLSVGISDLVMHCENQFFKFYKKGEAKFRHTATIAEKIKKIPELIELALVESLKQIETYKQFESTPLTKKLANKLVNEILGYDRSMSIDELAKLQTRSVNMMDTLYSNIDTETNIVGKNLWGLFNGVTRFTTHHIAKPKRENGLEESLIVGAGYKKNIAGFEFCLANS